MTTQEEEPLKTPKDLTKNTFKQKIIDFKNDITVEPILAFTIISRIILLVATQNLNLDKACRAYMKYGDKVCDAVIARKGGDYKEQELAIQSLVAGMESWKSIIENALPCFLILFVGAWSDKTGKRRLCIVLPIVGELLMCLSNIVNYYFLYELPLEATMFFEAFFTAITGGWITLNMGVFSYVSDISSKESRTFRIGIANLCLTAGVPVGTSLSGILLNKIGYYGVFSLSSLLYVICIIYACYVIKEPETKNDQTSLNGVWTWLKSFFDVKFIKNTAVVAFKKGPNNRRIKSILSLVTLTVIYGVVFGEWAVLYYFTRLSFDWDVLKFSFYTSFCMFTHMTGALVSICLFSRRLQWDDSVLGLISVLSKIMSTFAIIFAKTGRDLYIAAAIETFNATATTALRSTLSKLCSSNEIGKMMSVFNLIEVATKMAYTPSYMSLYSHTIAIDPKIMFYVSGVLTILPGAVFGWFFSQHKKELREESKKCLKEKNKAETVKNEYQLVSDTDLEITKIILKQL